MGQTGDFGDPAGPVKFFEPCIAIGMHEPGVSLQVLCGADAFAVHTEPVERRWRCDRSVRSLVTRIDPDPAGLCLAVAGRENRHRCIISMDRSARTHMLPNRLSQRLKQCCRLADPVGHCGALEIEPFPGIDLALPVEWQVVGILRDEDMREQARAGATAFDRATGKRGLVEPVTTGAGHAGAHIAVHQGLS